MNIEVIIETLAFASLLALVNERLVEKFVSPLLVEIRLKWVIPYIALLSGVLISLGFGIDFFTPLTEAMTRAPVVSWAGPVISGFIIGGGSSFLHDIWP